MGAVLAVIGTVLKWIGIILLWILGILLGILLLVLVLLAVPIRIRVRGEYRKDNIEADIRASYLLRLIQVKAYFKENALAWQLLVAGRRFAGSQKKPDEAAEEPETEPDEAVLTEEEVEDKVTQAEKKVVEPVEEAVESVEEAVKSEEPVEKTVKSEKSVEKTAAPEDEIPKWARDCMKPIGPSRWDKLWESIGARLAQVTDLWNEYKAYPNKREIVLALKLFLKRVLHSLRLRDTRLRMVLGLEDPGMMGCLMGVVSMVGQFCTIRGCYLEVEPDFEESRIEVAGQLCMHIHILSLIWITLRLALNRYVFRLIRYVLHRKK